MPRTNMDGHPIRRVLEWLLGRELTDADIAVALDIPASSYSRHKDRDDYPNFADLEQLGTHFGLNVRMLQIAFGWLDTAALVLLDEEGMRQFLQQGGGNYLDHPIQAASRGKSPPKRLRLERQIGVEAL